MATVEHRAKLTAAAMRNWGNPVRRASRMAALAAGAFRKHGPLVERFWAKVDKNGPLLRRDLGRCWIWVGAKAGRDGAGQLGAGPGRTRKKVYASRFAFETFVRPLKVGENVCHKCDYRPCIRPSHLFAGTQSDNMKDAVKKGRVTAASNSRASNIRWARYRERIGK